MEREEFVAVGSRGPASISTLDDRHRFTGKERDTESQRLEWTPKARPVKKGQ